MKHFLLLFVRPFVALSNAMESPALLLANIVFGASALSLIGESAQVALSWIIIVSLFTVLDLAYGTRAAIMRKERVTFSNAARRTVSKLLGYYFWLLGCCCWAQVTGNDAFSKVGCGLAAAIEALSALGNYLELQGYSVSLKGVLRLIGGKFSLTGLEDVVTKKDNKRGCGAIADDGQPEDTNNQNN